MADKTAEKPAGKLILFNHSRNPYLLKPGPNGEKRFLAVGDSIECLDQAEFDQLKKTRGMSTTAQVAPTLHAHIAQLEQEKADALAEIAELKKQNEKYQKKG